MDDFNSDPPREGARGGRDQFKWDDLKGQDLKEREHYLGHSVKVGLLERKNKFYKHDWYLKRETEGASCDIDEAALTRRYEEELMQEIMGLRPKRLMLLKSKPTDPRQLRELLDPPKADEGSPRGSSESPSHSWSPKARSLSRSRSARSRSSSRDSRRHRRRDHRSDRHRRRGRSRSHSRSRSRSRSRRRSDRHSDHRSGRRRSHRRSRDRRSRS